MKEQRKTGGPGTQIRTDSCNAYDIVRCKSRIQSRAQIASNVGLEPKVVTGAAYALARELDLQIASNAIGAMRARQIAKEF